MTSPSPQFLRISEGLVYLCEFTKLNKNAIENVLCYFMKYALPCVEQLTMSPPLIKRVDNIRELHETVMNTPSTSDL
jgi:hypothetical protein